jgi:hypothetical protein
MKKLYLIILLGCCFGIPAFAQTRIFKEVGQGISTSAHTIMENEVLVGYMAFTELERVDKDSFSYRITIMDENLNDLGVINFKELKLSFYDVKIEDNVLCLAYVKSNVLGYTYEHRSTRNKAFDTGKAWMFTQFITLKGEIIKTSQLPLKVDIEANWRAGYIPGSVLKNAITLKNISGKGFVCFYGDQSKKNLVFYDKNGQQTWEKKVSDDGEVENFITADHDVYLMMRNKENRNKYQYTVYSYNADNNNAWSKYTLKDKKGNKLLPLGFENDPISGKPDISGLILNRSFRRWRRIDDGHQIKKGLYGGVFNVQLNGHKKEEIKEKFSYWYDKSKSNVTERGHFDSGDGYITPNTSFRDFHGNTYYTGSVIDSKVSVGNIALTAAIWGVGALRLAALTGNPVASALVIPAGMALGIGQYRSFTTGNALLMKMDSVGKLKYESTLPVDGNTTTGNYDYNGIYCFTVVSPEDQLTYLVMSDDKAYVIYSVEQKKVIRTIKRDDGGKSVTVLPAKEGSIIVATVYKKEKYTMMSIEAI